MENQWKDIKTAYKRILNHAFDTEQQRDAAHVVLLKLCASIIDLGLSGDTTLKNATTAIIGDSIPLPSFSSPPLHERQSRNPSSNSSSNSSTSNTSNTPNIPNIPNIPNMPNMPNIPNLNSMFSFADNFLNRGGGESSPNSFITSEELRNLFPLWNMFDNNDATSRTNTTSRESTEPSTDRNEHSAN